MMGCDRMETSLLHSPLLLLPPTPCLRKFGFNDPVLITHTHTRSHTCTHGHTYIHTYKHTVRVWDVRPFAPADRQLKVLHGHKHGFEKVSVRHDACIVNAIKKNRWVACPPPLSTPQYPSVYPICAVLCYAIMYCTQ